MNFRRKFLCCFIGLALASLSSLAQAQNPPQTPPQGDQPVGAVAPSGLPLPRFVSLRSDKVNLRTGPGVIYPIEWVIVRRHMPVEVIAEFDVWRKIRDWQGTVGWVHQQMLDGRRMAIVTGPSPRLMRREPNDQAAGTAQIEPDVIAHLLECSGDWCRLEASGYKGWLKRDEFWGSYAQETIKE